MAMTPGGKTIYVTVSGGVIPVTTATGKAGPLIPVAGIPGSITITPDWKTAYVARLISDTITPISTVTNTAGTPVQVQGDAQSRSPRSVAGLK